MDSLNPKNKNCGIGMKPASKPFPSQEESMKTLRNLFAAALATAAILFTVGCPTPSEPTPPEEPVADVMFTPDGGAVKSGSSVTLDTATDGAEIWYAIDPENEITDANVQEMIDKEIMKSTANVSTTVKIEKACTIYAVAVRGSTGKKSSVTKASYTLAITPGTVAFDPATGTVVPSGTKVKLSATLAQGEESCTIYYSLTTALTDANYSTEGTVYDQGGDGIEITANTTIRAIAVGTTNNPGNPSSASYTLPVTLMQAAPEADDVVYIYYPTGKSVMLSTAADKGGLNSAEVTIDESTGGFTVTDAMPALSVFKNDIGQYVFVNSNGKYLTGPSRSNLTFADTITIYSLWEVEAVSEGSDTFYIHNANLFSNNTRQSLEYYKDYKKFTAYDRKTSNDYKFQFYKDPNKTSELTDQAKASIALVANSLATPKFSVSSTQEGQTIAPGTVTYLSSDSLDVDFYYTTDGSDITSENYGTKISTEPPTAYKYDASQGIAINGNQNDTVTINAIAVKTVTSGSEIRGIFSLSASAVYRLGEDTNTYLQKVTTLSDNDVVVIYLPSGKTTISSATSGKGFSGTSATESTKGLVLTDSLTQFTVKKLGENGYVFVNGGKYLSFNGTDSMVLADAFTDNSVWTLEQAGSSTDSFYIKNAGDSTKYIEFYNVFTVYSFQSSNTAIYTFQFYKNESGVAESVTLSVLPVSFSVPGGVVKADTPIALTSKTPDANIYWQWKTDSNEDLSSTNYTSATKYDASTNEPKTQAGTLQAIAEKAGQFSAMTSVTYSINNSPSEKLTFSTMNYTNAQDIASIDGTNVSLALEKGSNKNNGPKYYTSGTSLRFYGNNTMTATAKNSKKLNSIAITFQSSYVDDGLTADSGTVSTSGATVTWTAADTAMGVDSVVFTWSKSCRTQTMTFYYVE